MQKTRRFTLRLDTRVRSENDLIEILLSYPEQRRTDIIRRIFISGAMLLKDEVFSGNKAFIELGAAINAATSVSPGEQVCAPLSQSAVFGETSKDDLEKEIKKVVYPVTKTHSEPAADVLIIEDTAAQPRAALRKNLFGSDDE